MIATLDNITAAPAGWTASAGPAGFDINNAERGFRVRVSRALAERLRITERLEALVRSIGA